MGTQFFRETSRPPWSRAGREVIIYCVNNPPAITIIKRGKQGRALVASAGPTAGSSSIDQNLADAIIQLADKRRDTLPGFRAARLAGWYVGDAPWPWAEPEQLKLIRRLEDEWEPLEDSHTGTRVGIGVATGADKVFITTDVTVAEPDRLLPLAMAQDTRTGTFQWSGHYVVDPWGPNGIVDLSDYPKLAAYYEANAQALRRRNIAGRDQTRWYRTIDRVTHSLVKRDKLYFPDMKLQANPVLDQVKPIHTTTCISSSRTLGTLRYSEASFFQKSPRCSWLATA
jgi:adenine-specific DNA-methyltransferase